MNMRITVVSLFFLCSTFVSSDGANVAELQKQPVKSGEKKLKQAKVATKESADSKVKTEKNKQKVDQKKAAVQNKSKKVKKVPSAPTKKKLFHINSIAGIIFGKEETHLITTMDVVRPSIFEGRQLPEKEYFLRYLVYEDAQNYKIPVDDDTVDKYLGTLQRDQGLSLDALKRAFHEGGYTYEEGRLALKIMNTNQALLGFKIHDRLIVSDELVKTHHEQNPEVVEEAYLIEFGTVELPEGKSHEDIESEIKSFKETGQELSYTNWQEPYWLKKSEIGQQEILELQPGEVLIGKNRRGFDLVRLKEKTAEHARPLDDKRYKEIVEALRQPMYEKLLKEYEQELWEKMSILRPKKADALQAFDVVS